MNTFAELQSREIEAARAKHKPINSAHEGYSVILEELDEFWEEVRKKRSLRDKKKMVDELVQIAAMAQRTAEDVCMDKSPNSELSDAESQYPVGNTPPKAEESQSAS